MITLIDIKPGSFPNSINLGSNGVVPVAIFGSVTFDVKQIDPNTIKLVTSNSGILKHSPAIFIRKHFEFDEKYKNDHSH